MVVANDCWVRNAGFNHSQNKANNLNQQSVRMSAKGVLICRDNSHAFHDRTLNLEQAAKIGRSVARARVANNNAIFDCKVLSRNHALLWYSAGKFYLQDTRSSNGTFVNNQRLSATGLESTPREVCSGDIVQFGVDVMESTKKVTHGCIVATLKLYLPDGKEAKASRTMSVASPAGDVSLEDLYKLNQYIQEACRREKALENKLLHLRSLLENTKLATVQSWRALIDEDRLLSRVKTVESQLVACSKNLGDDKIRSEMLRLEEEKAHYQIVAKEALQKIHQEKLKVTQKLAQLEGRLNETEEECESLHHVSMDAQCELQDMAAKYEESQRNLKLAECKLAEKEESSSEIIKWAMQEKNDLLRKMQEQASRSQRSQREGSNAGWSEEPINIPKNVTAMRNYMRTLLDMYPRLICEVDATIAKDGVNPIKAMNVILGGLDAVLNNDGKLVIDTNLTSADSINNEANNSQLDNSEIKQLIIENTDELHCDKNELDDSPNKRDNAQNYVARSPGILSTTIPTTTTTLMMTPRRQQSIRNPTSFARRTLVNGGDTNLDCSTENDDDPAEISDDTSSVSSDETWIGFNEDNGEKSIIEIKQFGDDYPSDWSANENLPEEERKRLRRDDDLCEAEQQRKLEVRFASGKNGKDLEEVHYDQSYRPEEEFADVATAINDDDSSDSVESPNESVAATITLNFRDKNGKRNNDDENSKVDDDDEETDIVKADNLEHDDREEIANDDEINDGDNIKTLKPIGNTTFPNSMQSREYVIRTLMNSLDSLSGEEDDHVARRIVKRELDELRDWLVNESTDNIVDKLKELYYRAKNENQRIQEVNEELVILKEKYNIVNDEKTELYKQYRTLKAQCGDFLNASYSVPIQYVAPIAAVIVWMLLEKMF